MLTWNRAPEPPPAPAQREICLEFIFVLLIFAMSRQWSSEIWLNRLTNRPENYLS
jgi:hypothetical protein